MNVLVLTRTAWDDRIASGNTLSNFFEDWNNTKFYCLYSRDTMPNNKVCNNYYSISPISIVKNFFRPSKIGRRFEYFYRTGNKSENVFETKMVGIAKRHKLISDFICNLAYATNLWKNESFKKFIIDCNPDIVFCFGQKDPLTYRVVKYLKHHTKAKIISYYVDDQYRHNITAFNYIQKQQNFYLKEIACMSDLCYAISQKMCDEYRDLYQKHFHLLYKGCDISSPKTTVNSPIRFVYAGNLFYHRDKVLGALAKAIKRVNDGTSIAHLDIYSGTQINDKTLSLLNIEGSSSLHKARPFEDIKQIMKNADIVLHVESFDEEQMKIVRLSFSTKITDCMQSGSMMLAIGPKSVASMEYASRVPGCIVVNKLEDLEDTIFRLVNFRAKIIENAAKTNEFAKKNVELGQLRNKLKTDFETLIKSDI